MQFLGGSGIYSFVSAHDAAELQISGSSEDTLPGSNSDDSIEGDGGDDTLSGGNGDDTLDGGGGNDSLNAGSGDDQLYGGDGDDTLDAGSGDDTLNGGSGVNTASFEHAHAGVTVSLAVSGPQNTHGAGHDTLVNIEDLHGSSFNDTLDAGSGAETLDGGSGNDSLVGGGGNDSLQGGTGDDTIVAGSGNDTIDGGSGVNTANFDLAHAGVTVSLAVSGAQNTHGDGVDTLTNIQDLQGSNFGDTLTGSAGANTISGGAGNDSESGGGGNDVLQGGDGNDTLVGGAGSDTLTGGSGNDTFVYSATSDSTKAAPDLITDFSSGDKIDLHAIDANTALAGDQAFHVGGGGGHAGDIVASFNAAQNQTTLSLWTGNHAAADMTILLTGDHNNLSASNFIL